MLYIFNKLDNMMKSPFYTDSKVNMNSKPQNNFIQEEDENENEN